MNILRRKRWVKKCVSVLESFKHRFADLPFKLIPARIRLNQIGSAYREARLLYFAKKLDIADLIGDKKVSVDVLAKDINLDADTLFRVMRALVSFGLFKQVAPRVFANNRLSILLMKTSNSGVYETILTDHSEQRSALWFNALTSTLNINSRCCDASIDPDLTGRGNAKFAQIVYSDDDNSNVYSGFDWSLFDLVFYSANTKGRHVADILSSSIEIRCHQLICKAQ